jgi:hypothetical protein
MPKLQRPKQVLNGAIIEAGVVPAALAPKSTAQVKITVRNTGTSHWPAQSAFRLATTSANGVKIVGWTCGGYANTRKDARVFTCTDTAPGQAHTYVFTIKMPGSATGTRELALQMVQDGVEFFGHPRSWTIAAEVTQTLPNLVVDSVAVSPTTPRAGQAVTFSAVVRNAGSSPTPVGVVIGVGFCVDGTQVTWGTVNGPLAPGASVTVPTTGGSWTATAGSHTLTAVADDVNRITESNEADNARSIAFTVDDDAPSGSRLWGMNIDPSHAGGRATPAQLQDLGSRWVRIEWKYPQGFSHYDSVLAEYGGAGLKILLIVDYASMPTIKPSSTAGDVEWNDYRVAFAAQVDAIAQRHAAHVHAWQIWNEQDLSLPGTAYDPGVPPHQYAAMLKDAIEKIRRHSTKPIVWGGLASGDPGYVRNVRTSLGGSLPGDFIAVHPYGQRAPNGWPNPSWGFGNMSALFDAYLAFGKPLFVSEIGVDTTDEAFAADYLQNVYELVRTSYRERVVTVFWFCWSDAMVTPFGILRSDGSSKPAHARYRMLARGLPAPAPAPKPVPTPVPRPGFGGIIVPDDGALDM